MSVLLDNSRLKGHIAADDPAADGSHFTTGSDSTLTTVARGFIPDADGTLTVDFYGTPDRTPGTSIAITVLKGLEYALMITKIYSASPSGTVLY